MAYLGAIALLAAPPAVITVDDTVTTTLVAQVPANSLVHLEVTLMARGNNSASGVWMISFNAVRYTTGAAIALGGSTLIVPTQKDGPGTGGWHADVVMVGNDLLIQVDGAPGVTVTWLTFARLATLATF